MSFFKAGDVVIGGTGGSTSQPGKIQDWASNMSFSDGQMVTFNGSLYVAIGSPGVGLVPALEVAMPQTPGQPKWALAARGRTKAVAWDHLVTYYADQVVTYNGGTFALDAPTVPVGTRPLRDKRWLRMSETLTDAENERITTSDISSVVAGATVTIDVNTDEDARVRHHWVSVTTTVLLSNVALYVLKFPRPILSLARPTMTVHAQNDIGTFGLMVATPIISGNQITGYTMVITNGLQIGTALFHVTVKESIDQVTES